MANLNVKAPTSLPAGFISRPLTLGDIPEIVRVANTWAQHYSGRPEGTEEEERGELANPKTKLERDSVGLFAGDGNLAAFACFYDWDEPHAQYGAFMRVLPDAREADLLRYLVPWALNRAGQSIPGAPPDARCTLEVEVLATDEVLPGSCGRWALPWIGTPGK
ncbi:MAG: hypothetical protein WEB00_01740 [Dehalococcoidia bacterium]